MLVRMMVDPKLIPEPMSKKQEYTLDGTPVQGSMHTHSYLQLIFQTAKTPTWLFLGGENKLENLRKVTWRTFLGDQVKADTVSLEKPSGSLEEPGPKKSLQYGGTWSQEEFRD